MSTTFISKVELTTIHCCCGGTYAISETFRNEKQMVGGSWTCPYCRTGWGYAQNSDNERLKRQLAAAEREKQRLIEARDYQARRKDEAMAEAEHFRKSRDGMKGQLVRTKKAIANGVCPCCRRYFKDLHRHMLGQHPDYEEQKQDAQ